MAIPSVIQEAVKIVGALALGAVGATLFQRSLPPPEGTPEKRIFELEYHLKEAKQRIAKLEDINPDGTRKHHEGFMDFQKIRGLARDLREGRQISPDELWQATRPFLREILPLIELVNLKDENRWIDSQVGELAREFDLPADQQAELRNFFKNQSEKRRKKMDEVVNDPHSTLLQVTQESRKIKLDEGLDEFMESRLQGDKLTTFKTKRMNERLERVQRDADFKVQRLDNLVSLDEGQKDKVFAIMARGSSDYRPEMQLAGLTNEDLSGLDFSQPSSTAVRTVLRPEQIKILDEHAAKRRAEAEARFAEMNMSLPSDWDMLEDGELGWAD